MTCSRCGRETSGQVCSYCGTRLSTPDQVDQGTQAIAASAGLVDALSDGVSGAVATLPPALVAPVDSYPVQVTIDQAASANRLWAVPLLGYAIKAVILIPHFIALTILMFAAALVQLVLWVPVLLTGHYPEWGYSLTSGTLRWGVRVTAYFFGLTDRYPPFGPSSDEAADPYPVRVTFQPQASYNRAWAIPAVGWFVKSILLIPHTVILYALGIVVGFIQMAAWVPVLFGGKYPEWGYQLVGGHLRWSTRVSAYLLGLTDQYPPFQMG